MIYMLICRTVTRSVLQSVASVYRSSLAVTPELSSGVDGVSLLHLVSGSYESGARKAPGRRGTGRSRVRKSKHSSDQAVFVLPAIASIS